MLLLADSKAHSSDGDLALPERRRGLRIRQARPVKVFEPVLSRYFGGQTRDISSNGLRIELPVSIPIFPGRQIEIHIGQNQSGESLGARRRMVPARVIWIDRSVRPGSGRMVAGVQLLSSMAAQVDAA